MEQPFDGTSSNRGSPEITEEFVRPQPPPILSATELNDNSNNNSNNPTTSTNNPTTSITKSEIIPEEDTPIVTLSDSKLYKFRAYEMQLFISSKWRQAKKLTEKDVFEAGCCAKCCRQGFTEALQCDRCGRIVFIAGKTSTPEESSPGVEKYTFVVRSRCTSSREHLHSALVLFLDQLPTPKPVITKPFVVQARIKKTKRSSSFSSSDGGNIGTPNGYKSEENSTTNRNNSSFRGGISCFGGYNSSSGYLSGYSSTQSAYTSSAEEESLSPQLFPPLNKKPALLNTTNISTTQPSGQPSPMLLPQSQSSFLLQQQQTFIPQQFQTFKQIQQQLQQQQLQLQQQQQQQFVQVQRNSNSKKRNVFIMIPDPKTNIFHPSDTFEIPDDQPTVIKFLRTPMKPKILQLALDDLNDTLRSFGINFVFRRITFLTHNVFITVTSFQSLKDLEEGTALYHQYMLNTIQNRQNIFGIDLYKACLLELIGDLNL